MLFLSAGNFLCTAAKNQYLNNDNHFLTNIFYIQGDFIVIFLNLSTFLHFGTLFALLSIKFC